MTYHFEVPPNFKRVLKKKPQQMQDAVKATIEQLVTDPRHPGLQAHKMGGHPGVWEAYVDAGNRVTFHYSEDKTTIVLRNNCNHDMLRRNP